MVDISNFTGGMGAHSFLLGEGQVAYAENVDLRSPGKVTLGQKSTNIASTGTDLTLCAYGSPSQGFFGSKGGKVYNLSGTEVASVTGASSLPLPIYQMVSVGSYLYLAAAANGANVNNFKIARIGTASLSSSDWTSEGTRDAAHATDTFMRKYIFQGSDCLFIDGSETKLLDNDASGTITSEGNLGETIMSMWKHGQDIKAVTANGKVAYLTPTTANVIFSYNISGLMLDGVSLEGLDYLIGGGSPEGTGMYTFNGVGKDVIGKAYTDLSCESKKKFHFGRTSEVFSDNFPTHNIGNDVFASFNNIAYGINENKVLSWGSNYAGLPMSFDYAITTNSVGDTLTEIGFIKVLEDNTNAYLYYGWKNDAGNCGVDRVDITNYVPSSYWSSGVVYTKKYHFGAERVSIDRLKIRAKTTTGQAIKVYAAVDGGAYNLIDTLESTDPKEYHLISWGEMARELQFKVLLETDDPDETPELYGFTFNVEGYDS